MGGGGGGLKTSGRCSSSSSLEFSSIQFKMVSMRSEKLIMCRTQFLRSVDNVAFETVLPQALGIEL